MALDYYGRTIITRGIKCGYLASFPAGCRVGTTMLSADMLVRGGAAVWPPVVLAVRVIGA